MFQIEQIGAGLKGALADTLLLNDVPVNALFDIGVPLLHPTIIYPLDAYVIQTAETQHLVSNESIQGCILLLGSLWVQSDLLVLDTPTYDMIHGMGQLTKNDVQISCVR